MLERFGITVVRLESVFVNTHYEADEKEFEEFAFHSCSSSSPPLPLTLFVIINLF